MAEYLLAEVLDRQPQEVRRLLLRTSVLDRVNGELADLLTGGSGGERLLQQLEQANTFVVSLDARRSWFRYHQLFADLLQLELRGSAPAELPALHATAAGWYADHGYPVEAVRHAQRAEDWGLAARLLSDNWFGLGLDGLVATARELLSRFPAGVIAGDAELAARMAGDKRAVGSLDESERYLALATGIASVPADGAGARTSCSPSGAWRRPSRNDLGRWPRQAQRLLAPTGADLEAQLGLGEEVRTLALINLGIAELWAGRFEDSERHLEQGIDQARRLGRTYARTQRPGELGAAGELVSFPLGARRSMEAIELVRKHGWRDEPDAGTAYVALGLAMVWRGGYEEGEGALELAERTVRAETEPAAGMRLHCGSRAVGGRARPLRGRARSYPEAERMERVAGHARTRSLAGGSHKLQTLVRAGETGASSGPSRRWTNRFAKRGDARRSRGAQIRPGRSEVAAQALAPSSTTPSRSRTPTSG